jgi:bifunctional DNA-binding transcriptional regulator/antitoxin component of YhaV-PrlF toxin-antitoxin module
MANQTITADTITVHGRGSLVLPYKVRDASGTQIDISDWVVFFEVDGLSFEVGGVSGSFREQLVSDPNDPLGLRIILERAQIAQLTKTPMRFAVIDETDSASDIFRVLWAGTIKREGYIGAPDSTPDAGD